MNRISIILIFVVLFTSCKEKEELSSINPVNWENRSIKENSLDSLLLGQSYLSVYSQIYSETEHRIKNLTATISMRNTSSLDTLYLLKSDYYNTKGQLLRTYFEEPIYLDPLETVEIVIDEKDLEGGTGANFLFDWAINPESPEPIFEAVMISTYGQQGLSFSTQGKRIK